MFKRVISNPEDVGRTDGKMSRTSGEMSDLISNKNSSDGDNNDTGPTVWPTTHAKPNEDAMVVADAKKIDGGINFALSSPSVGAAVITSRQVSQSDDVPIVSMEQDATAAATAALEQVSLASDDENDMNEHAGDLVRGGRVEMETEPSVPPFPCITKPESPSSLTNSSLSDRSAHCDVAATSETAEPEPNMVPPDDGDLDAAPGELPSKGSKQSVASESASSTSEHTPGSLHLSGTWGWFEDPHQQDSPGVLGAGKNASSPPRKSTNATEEKTKGGEVAKKKSSKEKKKKKGGMLQFGAPEPLDNIVEPTKESTAMAVTAPMYVLEEPLSSQKLWKKTAGNRPPQPVEERAFYEKMWAQNFARSQVTYEMPVEVLTASSPIALSPFADGGFGAEGGSEHCHQISNYNLAAPFNPNVSHRIRGGNGGQGDSDVIDGADPATVKAAEADAAEASLSHRNNAVGMYFDPNRPRQNNLKTLGPHHHHHTQVNKKVKGSESGDDLTVVVRGDNVFGTTVSKSFAREGEESQDGAINGAVTVSISIASYRVVESKKHGKYAQFLVIYCEGTFRETVGVWKRYSDFSALADKVTHGHERCSSVLTGINPLAITEDSEFEMLPNAITSWRLLKKRQRWYRCLDAGYLSLKVFLLERFLHDILFESSSPNILRDFVGTAQTQKIN